MTNSHRAALRVPRPLLLIGLLATGCINMAPKYHPVQFELPDDWQGSSPFVPANPSDDELRMDWWVLFHDPVLNELEEQLVATNPTLEIAAEHFVQARDEMAKARSAMFPTLGIGLGLSANKQSATALFRAESSPLFDPSASLGGFASWQPDFWGKLRNAMNIGRFRAQERAADYALVRLSLESELAHSYFTLRRLDAQYAIYQQSISYYEKSLNLVNTMFEGKLASGLDVARAEYILARSKARMVEIAGRREVAEHAIAVLVNKAPSALSIAPVPIMELASLQVPRTVPATLLERRPDVAGMEREVAMAHQVVGIARAAFFPDVVIGVGAGLEGFKSLFSLASGFWSVGGGTEIPLYQGGFRRADLQESWSILRETEDRYRETVLQAFREVEDALSMTAAISQEVDFQRAAVDAAQTQQRMSMQLYRGGLASSLDLINAQVNTLESRLDAVDFQTELLQSTVRLVASLGGGWNREHLPTPKETSPFNPFGFKRARAPKPVGGINVHVEDRDDYKDLAAPSGFHEPDTFKTNQQEE